MNANFESLTDAEKLSEYKYLLEEKSNQKKQIDDLKNQLEKFQGSDTVISVAMFLNCIFTTTSAVCIITTCFVASFMCEWSCTITREWHLVDEKLCVNTGRTVESIARICCLFVLCILSPIAVPDKLKCKFRIFLVFGISFGALSYGISFGFSDFIVHILTILYIVSMYWISKKIILTNEYYNSVAMTVNLFAYRLLKLCYNSEIIPNYRSDSDSEYFSRNA